MAVNQSTLADEDGDFPDWVEIHNGGDGPVNLGGWHLTDNSGNPDKWTFSLGESPGRRKAGCVRLQQGSDDRRVAAAYKLPTGRRWRLSRTAASGPDDREPVCELSGPGRGCVLRCRPERDRVPRPPDRAPRRASVFPPTAASAHHGRQPGSTIRPGTVRSLAISRHW